MSTTLAPEVAAEVLTRYAQGMREIEAAREHPANFLEHVKCIDAKTGESFQFQLLEPGAPWHWQREVLDEWLNHNLNLSLKARQIGITWLAGGYGLWKALVNPGTRVLVVSINETEAVKVVNRIWDMFLSLPEHLQFGVAVQKPTRGARPSQLIEFVHGDGRVSSIIGLPSTPKAGHGETAALVLLDEFARHEYARETWKASFPTIDGGGQVIVVSTANGISNEQTGEGNFFHHLWRNAESYGITARFLGYDLHPDRDEVWYEQNARSLPVVDRAEQFPRTAEDAFIGTGECWFDLEVLAWYRENALQEPLYRARFLISADGRKARLHHTELGWLRIYEEPIPGHNYALAADVATGRGLDYSAAYVIDLANQRLVAEFRAKLDPDEYAAQLHFLGRRYDTARLAIEMGGGYGEPVIIALRDGRKGRPSYPKLYRHSMQDRPDNRALANYGFPINSKTRPLIINALEQAVREKTLPWLTHDLLAECMTFVRRNTLPSPAAADGCNDDCVMAAGLVLEMFRRYGVHPNRRRRRVRRKPHRAPWEKRRAA